MNTGLEESSPWDHVSAAPVINLDNRPERWERLKASAKGIIPDEKLVRSPAYLGVDLPGYGVLPWFKGKSSDTRWAARAGCTVSHREAAVLASKNAWGMTLILEDDADFSETNQEELSAVLRGLLSDQFTWDVCYLGFSKTRGPSRLIGRIGDLDVFEVSGCSAAHAYLVNAKARDWIIRKLPSPDRVWPWIALHRISDRWYSWNMSKHLKVIAISPSVVTQTEGYSDLVQNDVDYNIAFPGKVVYFPKSSFEYHMSRLWWRLQGCNTLIYDGARYLLKCFKGF